MKRRYLEVSIIIAPAHREAVIPAMIGLGSSGFHEIEPALICYFDTTGWTDGRLRDFRGDIRKTIHAISANAPLRFTDLEDRNWNEEWEKTIVPITVGNRFLIRPSWSPSPSDTDRIVLTIDPKMSFGTGYHETTRLMLSFLEEHVVPGMTVLDVGTGTGILAIGAVKLGASSAVGIDNDEWSILNAGENTAANGVEAQVKISNRGLHDLPQVYFDIVAANITLNTIIDLLPGMQRVLKRSGMLLLSGLLAADRNRIIESVTARGFDPVGTREEHGWIAIACHNSS